MGRAERGVRRARQSRQGRAKQAKQGHRQCGSACVYTIPWVTGITASAHPHPRISLDMNSLQLPIQLSHSLLRFRIRLSVRTRIRTSRRPCRTGSGRMMTAIFALFARLVSICQIIVVVIIIIFVFARFVAEQFGAVWWCRCGVGTFLGGEGGERLAGRGVGPRKRW